MASLFRIGITRVSNTHGIRTILNCQNVKNVGVRCISSKSTRTRTEGIKPAPWNYRDKKYTLLNYFFDKTTARFDENSKIIVVEGPVAAGKSKLAKALAEELEMLYMPEANLDMIYINEYGYDLRQLDLQVPETCRTFDVNDFLLNPKHRLTARFQIDQYTNKYSQYLDALAHVLSTGQGVVLDRCAYSDFVFAEALYASGYISKAARSVYYDVRKNTISELLRPHLIIYLDVPTKKIIENVKKRNISYEVNSTAINETFLRTMEEAYKQKYLKELSSHTELLVYDWSEGGDDEVVVEDIERINFKRADDLDPRWKDWVHHNEEEWACLRNYYADQKKFIMSYMNVPRYDVPELIIPGDDFDAYREILNNAPGQKYEKGYNTKMGDTGLLFKLGMQHRPTLPLRERRDASST